MCKASYCMYPCYNNSPVMVNLKQTFIHVFSICWQVGFLASSESLNTRVEFTLPLRKLWGGRVRSQNGGSHAYLSPDALVLFCLEEVEKHLQKWGVLAVGLHHITCTSHLLAQCPQCYLVERQRQIFYLNNSTDKEAQHVCSAFLFALFTN